MKRMIMRFDTKGGTGVTVSGGEFQPDFRHSILDILKSFEIDDPGLDPVELARKAFECYGDDDESFLLVRKLQEKDVLKVADYLTLGEECDATDEDQVEALSLAAAIKESVEGSSEEKGEALAKLAYLYMKSKWTNQPWRERDVMKSFDLLVEALSRGYRGAIEIAEKMRNDLFQDHVNEEVDVEYFVKNYPADVLCFAGFCLGVGLGWKKDTDSAAQLYENALGQGYERASHYLNEIRAGRV